MPWDVDLNDLQKEAIRNSSQNRAVIAGPGTGKTMTLLRKALQLVEDRPPAHLRVVNFTNAGVHDLRRKVATQPEYAPIRARNITTFHSLALRALHATPSPLVPIPLVILDDWEEATFLDQLAKEHLGLRDVREARKLREDYNSRWCIASEEVDEWTSDGSRRAYQTVYQQAKDLLGFTTRGELTFQWWQHMRSVPGGSKAELGFDSDYLLVDEYQDLNECEHEILQMLSAAGVEIFAVGDPNQSIYESMRHAHPELCWDFPKNVSPGDVAVLQQSYRCPQRVLQYGAALFPDPKGVPDPEQSPSVGEVHVLSFPDDSGERSALARLAASYLGSDSAARIIVAVPARRLAREIAGAIRELGIEVDDRTKGDPPENLNCRLARALFRLMKEPNDSVAAATAIVLHCAPTTRDKRALELLLLAHSRSFRVAELLASGGSVSGAIGTAINKVRHILEELENTGDVAVAISTLTGCEFAAPVDEEHADSDNLEVTSSPVEPGKVTIMTLHGSKGLEAEWVFLPAVEPGYFESNEVGAKKEERRRLLFVGVTRALQGAYITYAQRRYGSLRYMDRTTSSARKGASGFVIEACDRIGIPPENGVEYISKLLGGSTL